MVLKSKINCGDPAHIKNDWLRNPNEMNQVASLTDMFCFVKKIYKGLAVPGCEQTFLTG